MKKLILGLLLFSISAFAVIQTEYIDHKLELSPEVKSIYPNERILSIDQIGGLDIGSATAGQCLIKQSDGSWSGGTCSLSGYPQLPTADGLYEWARAGGVWSLVAASSGGSGGGLNEMQVQALIDAQPHTPPLPNSLGRYVISVNNRGIVSWATDGGGLSSIETDPTLIGAGTISSLLRVANPFTTQDETNISTNTTNIASNTTKLAGIEDRATADQTASEIKTSLETLTGDDRLDASAVKNLPEGGVTEFSLDDADTSKELKVFVNEETSPAVLSGIYNVPDFGATNGVSSLTYTTTDTNNFIHRVIIYEAGNDPDIYIYVTENLGRLSRVEINGVEYPIDPARNPHHAPDNVNRITVYRYDVQTNAFDNVQNTAMQVRFKKSDGTYVERNTPDSSGAPATNTQKSLSKQSLTDWLDIDTDVENKTLGVGYPRVETLSSSGRGYGINNSLGISSQTGTTRDLNLYFEGVKVEGLWVEGTSGFFRLSGDITSLSTPTGWTKDTGNRRYTRSNFTDFPSLNSSMQSLIDELGIESRHPDIPEAEDPIEEVSALPSSPVVDRIYNLDRDAGGFKSGVYSRSNITTDRFDGSQVSRQVVSGKPLFHFNDTGFIGWEFQATGDFGIRNGSAAFYFEGSLAGEVSTFKVEVNGVEYTPYTTGSQSLTRFGLTSSGYRIVIDPPNSFFRNYNEGDPFIVRFKKTDGTYYTQEVEVWRKLDDQLETKSEILDKLGMLSDTEQSNLGISSDQSFAHDINNLQNQLSFFDPIRTYVNSIVQFFSNYSYQNDTTTSIQLTGISNLFSVRDTTVHTSTGITHTTGSNEVTGFNALRAPPDNQTPAPDYLRVYVRTPANVTNRTIFGADDASGQEVPLIRINNTKLQYNSAGSRTPTWTDFTDNNGSVTLTTSRIHDFYFEVDRLNASTVEIVLTYKDSVGAYSVNDASITGTTSSLVFTTINSSTIEETGYRFEAANANTYITHSQQRERILGYTETNLLLDSASVITTHHSTRSTFTGNLNVDGNLFIRGVQVLTGGSSNGGGSTSPTPQKHAHFGTMNIKSETETGLRTGGTYSNFIVTDNSLIDTAIHFDTSTIKLPTGGGIEYNNDTGEFKLKAGVWILCASIRVENRSTGNNNNNRLIPEVIIRNGAVNIRHSNEGYARWNAYNSVSPDSGGAGAGTTAGDRVARNATSNSTMSVTGTIISDGSTLNSIRFLGSPQGSGGTAIIKNAHTHFIYLGEGEAVENATLQSGSTNIYGTIE